MQAQQKLEIADRIKDLRERSPYKQEAIANKLGLKLRSYQKLEAKGTEDFERCEALYEIHKEWASVDPEWAHMSAGWIWDGRDRRKGADLSDLLKAAEPNDLSLVEQKLNEALELLHAHIAATETRTAEAAQGAGGDDETLGQGGSPGS